MTFEPYYDRDGITIYHGDCLEVMAGMEPESVDAIVTDPPFGTAVDRDGYGRRQNYGGIGRAITGDSDLSALDGMLGQAGRVLSRKAWLAIFCSPKRHAETATVIEAQGFRVAGEAIWDKASPGLGGGIRYQHETILLCQKGDVPGRGSMLSVLRHFLARENSHLRHPHQKPVPLMVELVRYCSRKNNVVLDPFAGSGSTLVACQKTGRRGIGIESEAKYLPVICRRVEEARTPLLDTANGATTP